MIYIVSGFMRSGTSAMMAALIAGGMTAEWSQERNQLANNNSDKHYHPNKSGLYEVPLREYGEATFPLQYQGKLIKVMSWGLDSLAVNREGYRVIVMHRDPEEIRQSYEAFFERPLTMPWFHQYEQRMDRAVQMLLNRKDVSGVNIVRYRSLIEQPLEEYNSLLLSHWGIDPLKSAGAIDPTQYRFRRELLVDGI